MIYLQKAVRSDCQTIHEIQVKAFGPLLEKYHYLETNPAAESIERIVQRFEQNFTDYYLIFDGNRLIGMLRVCDFEEVCRISPICILSEYQGHVHAQKALLLAETLYPNAKKWTLDTILQEKKLCYLYEKMGYKQTGKFEKINNGMDLVFYEKTV